MALSPSPTQSSPFPEDASLEVLPDISLTVRGEFDSRDKAKHISGDPRDAIKEALSFEELEFLEFPREYLGDIAILDWDFHSIDPPPYPILEAKLFRGLTPFVSFRSRNGGLKALFLAGGGLRADEWASLGAFLAVQSIPGSTAEVDHRTRLPKGPVRFSAQSPSPILRSILAPPSGLSGVLPQEVEAFRESRGWSGKDAPHHLCPFDPGHVSRSSRPVYITDSGVRCLSCKGRGVKHFASWNELLGVPSSPGHLETLASSFVDQTHSMMILRERIGPRLNERAFRLLYRAYVKIRHPSDDPRIPLLSRNKDGDFVRGLSTWLDPIGLAPVKLSRAYFSAVPSCLYVKPKTLKDGSVKQELKQDLTSVERTQNPNRIPGWVPIIPVRGFKVWGHFQEYPTLPDCERIAHYEGTKTPRYLRPSERMSRDESWGELLGRFPGLSREYLALLIVSRGYAESGAGKVPRLMVTGPSSSAKSTTVRVAGAIVGDPAKSIPYGKQFREQFDAAVPRHGFLLCDEFAKPSEDGREEGPSFNFFLDMESRDYSGRLIYIGCVPMTLNSSIVVTGTGFPPSIRENVQYGRRFIHVALSSRVPQVWEKSCGFGDVGMTREALPEVCDAILSEIIDEFFPGPSPTFSTFEEAANSLGFSSVEESLSDGSSDDEMDPFTNKGRVYRLFKILGEGSQGEEPPDRLSAKGRRAFRIGDDEEIAALWRELCDDPWTSKGRARAEKVEELDLRKVLGLGDGPPVALEVKTEGQLICLRFTSGSRTRPAVNQEIPRS